MKRHTANMIAMTAVLAFTGCATTDGITVNGADDRTEDQVRVSSELFNEPFMGFPSPADYFFEAAIDKQSGQKRYELYVNVNAENWKKWDRLTLNHGGKAVTLPVAWLGTDMTCNDYGCAHSELGVARIDQETMDYIAGQSAPVRATMGSTRISDTLTIDVDPAEAQAFLKEAGQVTL